MRVQREPRLTQSPILKQVRMLGQSKYQSPLLQVATARLPHQNRAQQAPRASNYKESLPLTMLIHLCPLDLVPSKVLWGPGMDGVDTCEESILAAVVVFGVDPQTVHISLN